MRVVRETILNGGELKSQTVTKSIKFRKTKCGTLRINHNKGLLDTGFTSTPSLIAHMDKDVIVAINDVLDAWGFPEAEDDYNYGTEDSHEVFHACYKYGYGQYAEKTALRTLRAQMPIFSVLAENSVLDTDTILTDYYYSEGETVLVENSAYRHASTIKEFTYEAFGFYRKDLVKSVTQCNVIAIEWVSWWSPFLTEDETINTLKWFIENPPDMVLFECLTRGIVQILGSHLNKKSIKRLAKGYGLFTDDIFIGLHIHEAINRRTIAQIADQKIPDWHALHRSLQKAFLETFGEDRIELPKNFEELNSDRVHVLTNTDDYAYTGEVLENCVGYGSSFEKSLEGSAYHIRFDGDDGPEALMEIRPNGDSYKISQFYGHRNATLSEEDKAEYLSWITPKFSLLDRKALVTA